MKNAKGSRPNGQDRIASSLRMLAGSPRQKTVANGVVLPFSRNLYDEIATAFQLPSAVIGYVVAAGSTITEFEAFHGGSGILAVLNSRKMAITHDPVTCTTYALVMGLCIHERLKLIEELERFQAATPLVAALVTAWLSVSSQLRGRKFVDRKLAILDIESEIGVHWSSDPAKKTSLRRIDFAGLTRRLTTLNNAWDDTAIDFQLKMISKLIDVREDSVIDLLRCEQPMSRPLRLRLMQIKDLLTGLRTGNEEIKQRATIVLQTVSMIGRIWPLLTLLIAIDTDGR